MNLQDSVSTLPFVGPAYQKKLGKLEIFTISDLLHHIPHRYIDFSKFTKIKDVKSDDLVSIYGEVKFIKNQATKSGKLMQIATLEDSTGQINLIWFNQYFLIKTLFIGTRLIISGKASWFNRKIAFFNPVYEKIDYPHESVHTGKIVGIYPTTAGLSNKWLKARIKYALDRVNFDDFLEDRKGMYSFNEAIYKIHFPKTNEEAQKAHDRLAFNEFYNLLLIAKERKSKLIKKKNIKLKVDGKKVIQFIQKLPFKLTNSQNKVITEILSDLSKGISMNRLLQGDVGSGKTVVAAVACYVSFLNGYQTVFLAPTQILANQHFKTLSQLFNNSRSTVKVALITASTTKVSKADVYVGTHALINKSNYFKNIGLVVIDEQHKFGVKQSDFMQNLNPHKLTMTATPIPRTIAQTLFSDMDLSILNEVPKNKAKIKTWLVPNEKREKAYEWIITQIRSYKSQAFVICPLVEESESETLKDIKSVKTEYLKLKTIFKDFKLGLLHGKMKEKEKTEILNNFREKKIDMLVSTPVVEVGIDIPNATIMLIESADRFGLASLHQLRGRIGRGDKESYCLLFTDNESEKVNQRLMALTKVSSGFDLAEIDFKLRGAGELLGTKQSGFGDLKIADWSQSNLINIAKEVIGN